MTRSKPAPSYVPPSMLMTYAALIIASLILVGWSRLIGATPAAAPMSPVVDVRQVVFEDLPDGSIKVRLPGGEQTLGVVAAGDDGFVRSTLRGMKRERMRFGVDKSGVLELIRRLDGSLTLNDPSTNIAVDLGAFGPSNAASFAEFMTPLGAKPTDAGGTASGAVPILGKSRSSG